MDKTLLSEFEAIVGPKGIITEATDMAPYLSEERGLYHGKSDLVVRPANTEEVSQVVALCAKKGLAIVPQGGNTGLCGGAVANGEVILSLGRLNKVRALDPLNATLTVEAGTILKNVQTAAEEAGFLFPLSLGAEGSCQIGGNLATNAGGVNVLKYGNSRDLVLGLEVVLPDGRIWNGLKGLRKDNTGYDLKHLFLGSEGTLGIITAAVLKLFPLPKAKETALIALPDLESVAQLLSRAKALCGDSLSAFEFISRFAMELVSRHVDGVTDPFDEPHAMYVLLELTSPNEKADLRTALESLLEAAFEEGLVEDAVFAESGQQAEALWNLRESIPEAQKHEGASIKHDISVPVSKVAEFIATASQAVTQAMPGLRPCPFGHMGDGNIHFNLTQPEAMEASAYLDHWDAMNRIVHDIAVKMGGSFSAEHGIGKLKVEEIVHYKDAVEVDLMRAVKNALDPQNTLNPGKIVR